MDEATTYNDFASLPFWWMWRVFDANHHVLHTILCHISTSVLPLSAFSLRLPSLAGGALYLWAAYRVCALLCPRPPVLLSTYALLTLNPFLLDYLSAARGYGLASAFWMASVYFALRLLRQSDDPPALQEAMQAGLFAGLSVAANLSFAFAAVPELLALGAVLSNSRKTECGAIRSLRSLTVRAAPFALLSWRRPSGRLVASLVAPALAVFLLIDLLPLLHNHRPFILGAASVRASFDSVAGHVLFYSSGKFDVAGLLADPTPAELWILGIARWGAISAGMAAALFLLFQLRSSLAFASESLRFALFLGVQLGLSMVCLAAAHSVFGVLYPVARSGIYLMLAVPLFCAAIAPCVTTPPWAATALERVYVIAAGALALWFLAAIQFTTYSEWRFDRNTLELFHRIQDAARRDNRMQARVGTTYLLAPPLEFYRRALHDTWLAPVESFNGAALAARAKLDQFDYFATLPQDESIARAFAPRRIWSDPATGAVLAAVPESAGRPGGVRSAAGSLRLCGRRRWRGAVHRPMAARAALSGGLRGYGLLFELARRVVPVSLHRPRRRVCFYAGLQSRQSRDLPRRRSLRRPG